MLRLKKISKKRHMIRELWFSAVDGYKISIDFIKEMKTNVPEVAQKELTNFEKIDLDILIKQNQSLVNKINKLQHDWLENNPSEGNSTKVHNYSFNKCLIDLAGQLKKFFHEKSFGTQADPLVKDLSLFLHNFFNLVEDICIKRSCLDQAGIKKWFELNKLPLEIFYSKLKQTVSTTQSDPQLFYSLDQKITQFQQQYLLPSQIPKETLETQIQELNVKIEDLVWENSILQNNISFLYEYHKMPIKDIIDTEKNKEKYYCYCGGHIYKDTIDQLHIEEMRRNFQGKLSTQEKKVEQKPQKNIDSQEKQKYEEQITMLKNELQNIIELLEEKKLSKNTLSELVLSSNFFQTIQEDFKNQQDYLQEISLKYEYVLKQALQLEQLRKKELQYYRKQEDVEKQKLREQIQNLQKEISKLNQSIQYYQQQVEQLEKIKVRKQINSNDESMLQNLNTQIQTLTQKYFDTTAKQNIQLQKKVEALQKNLFSLEKEKFLDKRIQNRDFRHKEHKRFIDEIKIIAKDNKNIMKMTDDVERYLKTREKKIRNLEKTLEDYKKYLEDEKTNNKCLIDEIVNSSKAFEKLQNNSKELSQELENITNNFNDVFNEKSLQQKVLKDEVEKLENNISKIIDEKRLLQSEIANLQFIQTQKDKDFQNLKFKISDLENNLKQIHEQYQKVEVQNKNLIAKLELHQSKLDTLKASNKTLSKELSENVGKITEKEAMIKSLLQNDFQDELQKNSGDISKQEKRLYLMSQFELKRLQNIIQCKACHVREKEVILTTCFHSFCKSCVDKNFSERSRQCPICMKKMSRYEIKPIYLDQLNFKKFIFINGSLQIRLRTLEEKIKLRTWEYRQRQAVHRCSRPSRVDKARQLGYKAKQGFVIYRVRVRRGNRKRPAPKGVVCGKLKSIGITGLKSTKNYQSMAEETVGRKMPELKVLNSYWVGQDATFKFFEVIMVDASHNAIRNDPRINWICDKKHREMRGLTSKGKKHRGLRAKGDKDNKKRPSRRANYRRRNIVKLRRYR